MSDLTNRLRCRYPQGPILENGEPEFGWRDMSGPIQGVRLPTPLMLEAAKHIEELERQLADMTKAVEGARALMGQLAATQPTAQQEDARDAARYRWVMDQENLYATDEHIQALWRKVSSENRDRPTKAEWDAAIDAAMQAGKETGK